MIRRNYRRDPAKLAEQGRKGAARARELREAGLATGKKNGAIAPLADPKDLAEKIMRWKDDE